MIGDGAARATTPDAGAGRPPLPVGELLRDPGVRPIVVAHAQRGLVLQLLVRAILVVFMLLTVLLLPPGTGAAAATTIAGAYAVAAVGLSIWLLRGQRSALRWGWSGLYLDLAAVTAVSLIADQSADVSWTANVLQAGFFLLPVLAATQLRLWVCAGIVVPTVLLYAVDAIITRGPNGEPWASVALRVVAMAGVGAAAFGLARIQRSRVSAIATLAADRSELLGDLMTTTDREQRALAEHLHDGALQYILAARFDLEDAHDTGDPGAFERLDHALTAAARQLRSDVSQLHPAVLEQAGLPAALNQVTAAAADRGGLTVHLDTAGWPTDTRTHADPLLYGAARELVTNVVKHAQATELWVALALRDGNGVLSVRDNGVGADPAAVAGRVAQGHIGLDSNRVKLEAAGGRLVVEAPAGGGTAATVTLPVAAK